MLIADTGGLFALYDANDKHHLAVRRVVESHRGPIVVPLPVLAELDHFLVRYLGQGAAVDFLVSISDGAFILDHMTSKDLDRCQELLQKYRDLQLGFVDASVLAVAERLGVLEILTLDHRDFRAVGEHRRGVLKLLPADA